MVSLDVQNIDKLMSPDDDSQGKENKPIHPWLIPHKSRVVVVGASSSGKTNWLCDAIISPKLRYEKIYCYSRNLDQPKYEFMKKELQNTEDLIEDQIIMAWENTLDDLVELTDLDPECQNLIIIDDFNIANKIERAKLANLYTQCRHRNASIIFLAQLLFQVDRAIRNNLSHLIIFNNYNKREVELMAREIGTDLCKHEFQKLYSKILNKKFKWMMVDLFNEDPSLKYRDGYRPYGVQAQPTKTTCRPVCRPKGQFTFL